MKSETLFWAVIVAAVAWLLCSLMYQGITHSQACTAAGGVDIRGVCVDKKSVVEIRP